MRMLLGALLLYWACGCSHAQSTIRISAYPYPEDVEYGMRIQPRLTDPRLKRNPSDTTLEEIKEEARQQLNLGGPSPIEDDIEESQEIIEPSPVNRMGLAAPNSMTRRKVPSFPQGPRPRSSVIASTPRSTTLRSFGNIPGFLPPSPPENTGNFGPPAIPSAGGPAKPPAPPVFPPSTPQPSLSGNFGPPAIPDPINSPSPPPGADEAQVTKIKCMDTGTTSSFMALLSLPLGYNAIPVFGDRPSVDPTTNTACRMIPTQLTNDMFQLIVSDLDRCGVRRCRQSNGETWLCLTLRFPLVNGLKLPEDETILIRCRPQDKTKSDTQYLTVATTNNDQDSPSVFEGGQHDFKCEIGLFRKLPGTQIFAARVTNEVELDLGEEVQLRSIVRPGDGWQFSLLTTIIIQKSSDTRAKTILNAAADLVFADGCRNPTYKVIAKNHPKRDPRNPLINNFNFRIFMFQDMSITDNLMITANVIGCVDAQDCAPTECDGVDETDRLGYGRKKRGVKEFTFTSIIPVKDLLGSPPYPPPLAPSAIPASRTARHAPGTPRNATTHWDRNLSVRVKIPNSGIQHKPVEAHECQLYLFITLGVAATFCIASIVFVIVTLFRSRSSHKRYQAPIPVSHIGNRPHTPGTLSSTLSSSSSGSSSTARLSSISSSKDSDFSRSSSSPLKNFAVPPTVRQRKREVNTELLNVFESERLFPYGTYCPGMLNYYGYMVVPRKTAEASNEKRSLRAIKRDLKRHRDDRQEQHHHQSGHCRCTDSNVPSTSTIETESINSNQSHNHKSVIHIPASQQSCIGAQPSVPKPLPRMTRSADDENIYSEVFVENNPTMV